MYRPYNRYIDYAHDQQQSRMGYPLTGAVCGFFNEHSWIKTNNSDEHLISQTHLGLTGQNPATTLMLNIGDASSSLKDESHRLRKGIYYPEDIENEVIHIFAKYFQIKETEMKGYVTSGGTEANLASIWWLRNAYKNQKSSTTILQNPVVVASDQAHYSCAKVAQILNLELITIPSKSNGEIELSSLIAVLKMRHQQLASQPFIVWLNAGTTVLGAIDNIAETKKLLNTHMPDAQIRIHIDGAILGAALPLLMPEVSKIFDYADTLTISGHKLLGTPLALGVALAKKEILDLAFTNTNNRIGYVHYIEDITISGGRSALPIFQLHIALQRFEISSTSSNLRKMLNTNLSNAKYLAAELKKIIGDEHVIYYAKRFNVIFTLLLNEENATYLKEKYTLMPLDNQRVGVTVFANVDKKLIDQFLNEYKKLLTLENEQEIKFRAKF